MCIREREYYNMIEDIVDSIIEIDKSLKLKKSILLEMTVRQLILFKRDLLRERGMMEKYLKRAKFKVINGSSREILNDDNSDEYTNLRVVK